MYPLRHNITTGFTLVEVAVVIPLLIVFAIALFSVLFAMLNSTSTERTEIGMSYDKTAAINLIESDSLLASTFLTTNDSFDTDLYPPSSNGGNWSYRGDSTNSRVLLLREYSTTANPLSTNRQPIYMGDPSATGSGGACSTTLKPFNAVLSYNVIYFVKASKLYRRRLIDSTTATCDPQYQKYSCPSQADLNAQGLGTRNPSCQANDEVVATDVTNFYIDYFSSKASTSPLDVYANGADNALVTTAVDAQITLTVSRKAAGSLISSTSLLRISRLNSNSTNS